MYCISLVHRYIYHLHKAHFWNTVDIDSCWGGTHYDILTSVRAEATPEGLPSIIIGKIVVFYLLLTVTIYKGSADYRSISLT